MRQIAARLLVPALLTAVLAAGVPLAVRAQHPAATVRQAPTGPLVLEIGRMGGNIRPFSIKFYADGTIDSTGLLSPVSQHVRISKDAVKGLLKLATAEKFMSLPAVISGQQVLPDIAFLYITVHLNGQTKMVKVHGAHNAAFFQLYGVAAAAAGACDGVGQFCSS